MDLSPLLIIFAAVHSTQPTSQPVQPEKLKEIADGLGAELWNMLGPISRREEIQQAFESNGGVSVTVMDGEEMVGRMADQVGEMMQQKVDAVKRIMDLAENIALDHRQEEGLGRRLLQGQYNYYSSKRQGGEGETKECRGRGEECLCITSPNRDKGGSHWQPCYPQMVVTANEHFSGTPINLSHSSVHVPTDVFDGEEAVINAIDWSRKLEDTFKDNYQRDPGISWQYFGSSTGFLRQYPAMTWPALKDDPDMFDSRQRDWYINSATTPKEIVILLDTSGSMDLGFRLDIAKHVVYNVMATLSEDDFITVLTFANDTRPLVDWFVDALGDPELVQASKENSGEFTETVKQIKTQGIANFSIAFNAAFTLLEKYRTNKFSAESNQAIMLITDGIPSSEDDVFQEHNQPHKVVRVFTYLVGREVSHPQNANKIACDNRGFFSHVKTLSETKEKVVSYLGVMARPLILLQDSHRPHWTGVYANIQDPKSSLWLWKKHERKKQKKRTVNYQHYLEMIRSDGNFLSTGGGGDEEDNGLGHMTKKYMAQIENFLTYGQRNLDRRQIEKLKKENERKERIVQEIIDNVVEKWSIPPKKAGGGLDGPKGHQLMTSVSVPVYKKKNHKLHMGELLGVAGTDVPIAEIVKLVPPYMLGVGGYSFAVNNNGHLLYHPDLRPMFSGEILKPNYNSVDMA